MDSGAGEDADWGAGLGGHHTPRWVKISGAIALIVVLVLIGVLLFGDGEHGPGRHTGVSDGVGDGSAPTSPVEVQGDALVLDTLSIQVGDDLEEVHHALPEGRHH